MNGCTTCGGFGMHHDPVAHGTKWGADCPHEHVWRGECVDCLTDVAWTDHTNVSKREASTRKALAGVALRLRVYGRAKGSQR